MEVIGTVTALSVFGNGQNSAEIQFTVDDGKTSKGVRVGAYPATEPQVFAAFSTMLTAAYTAVPRIQVSCQVVTHPAGSLQLVGLKLG